MSKILDATCSAEGKVTIDGIEVPVAIVMSAGKQASSGVALFEEDKVKYLTSSASDIETTLDKTISALDDIASAITTIAQTLTAIGAGMTGSTTAPPGSLPGNVSTINQKVTEINEAKQALTNLKGALK